MTRVVVADAHAAFRAGVRAALEDVGMTVVEAATSSAAVEAVAPDLVVLDIELLGGLAATEALAARTRVVVLTGSDEHLFAALDAGATGYLLKDEPPEALARALHSVLEGQVAMQRRLMAQVVAELRRRGRPGDDGRPPIPGGERLTDREWEVLRALSEGLPTRATAERFGISEVTVRRHVSALVAKLGVRSRADAVELLSGARARS